jgi:hypothetical protein
MGFNWEVDAWGLTITSDSGIGGSEMAGGGASHRTTNILALSIVDCEVLKTKV